MNESRREVPRYKQDGTRHKKNWVQRQCQVCNNWESSSKMAVDHIEPVIPVEGHAVLPDGSQDWNEFVDRLWCNKLGKANLQRICDTCHDKKTYEERITRLTKQYMEELDGLEHDIHVCDRVTEKELKKELNKYIAKKKTKGLEPVVQRAQAMKNRFCK